VDSQPTFTDGSKKLYQLGQIYGRYSTMKTVVIKETDEYRLTITNRKCLNPKELNIIEIIQDTIKKSEITNTVTHQFFMSDLEVAQFKSALE
jgi:uncharacterized protein (UPF0333 family)